MEEIIRHYLAEISARDKKIESDVVPYVGVWWLYDGEVITFSTKSNKADKRVSGSTEIYVPPQEDEHRRSWVMVQEDYPELEGKPFNYIPRGRVIIMKKKSEISVIIFCSMDMVSVIESNKNKIKTKILRTHRASSIKNIVIEPDSHYGCQRKVFDKVIESFGS